MFENITQLLQVKAFHTAQNVRLPREIASQEGVRIQAIPFIKPRTV
jgi:hypothetical protein